VYFEAWSTAINNGEVAAMIKMIQNGLTLKTPNVKQYDQLQVKKEVMDFTRAETETCNDCIQRFTELTERAKAMDASLGSRESLLVFLFANKKYYANKPVLQIEVYLDEMITTAENQEVKRPKFDKVAKLLNFLNRKNQFFVVHFQKYSANFHLQFYQVFRQNLVPQNQDLN
jgi:hypothetical protein